MNIFDYNRIIILGNNGSGKSFFSKKLSVITGLPVVHLDVLFWRPNWEKPSKEDWKKTNIELISSDKWIIDGNVNHGKTMELRFKAADLVIFLDINRFVCLVSVIRRNGKKRSDTTQYLYEKFNMQFFRFCKRLWSFPNKNKQKILDMHKKYPDKPFLVINNRRELSNSLSHWKDDKLNNITLFYFNMYVLIS